MVSQVRRHLVGNGARQLLVVPSPHRHNPGAHSPSADFGLQHGRRVVNVEFAIPALIILGCALLIGLVAYSTRKKRAHWDIFPGPPPEAQAEASDRFSEPSGAPPKGADSDVDADADAGEDPVHTKTALHLIPPPAGEEPAVAGVTGAGAAGLAEWHQRHEQAVTEWIENHQAVLRKVNESGLRIDLGNRDEIMAGYEELAPRIRAAIASHPSPVMRAELSAMHVASEAAVFAVLKSDYETARRQHLVYVQYRDEWIERLRQFSPEPMSNLRAVMATSEFELEEIRSALETALDETDDTDDPEADFEAPLVVKEQQPSAQRVADQIEEALEAAVGDPEDTTATLEGGRVRRLLRGSLGRENRSGQD